MGIVASLICVGTVIAGEISDTFSASFSLFFKLSWITLLIGYAPMFLAFIKLRKTDANAKRPYKMPGSNGMVKFGAILAFVLLVAGIIFTLFGDFTIDYLKEYLPLYVGVAASFILEEIFVAKIKSKK